MSLETVQDHPPRAHTTTRRQNRPTTRLLKDIHQKTLTSFLTPYPNPEILPSTPQSASPTLLHSSPSPHLLSSHHSSQLSTHSPHILPQYTHLSHPSLYQNTHSNQPINHQNRAQVNKVARVPQTTAITGSASLKSSTPLQLTTSPSLTNTQHH